MNLHIFQKAGEIAGKVSAIAIKNAPTIFLAAGLTSIGTGTILACRATLKTRDELVEKAIEKDMACENPNDSAKLRTIDTISTITKNYALPVALIGGGTALIIKGHTVQQKRLIATIAAYNALDAGFRQYRQRVVENEGEGWDKAYLYGLKDETVEVEETDPETGKPKKLKKRVTTVNPDELSVYSRCFDQFNSDEWKNDPVYNQAFIRGVQAVFNDILKVRGYVFLNEVYRELGFREVPMGQAVGWLKGYGDDYIDFGMFDARNRKAVEFLNGAENCLWLDFNVDGIIWDKI